MLAMRDQFKDFDANFTIERPPGGMVLVCKNPVIRGEDVSWVVTGQPTVRADGPPPRWTWRFRKEPITGDAAELIGRELDMTVVLKGDLVEQVAFPEPVLKVVPAEVITAMMKALGTATINREARTAQAIMAPQTQPLPIPTRAQLLAWFGLPHDRSTDRGVEILTFRYSLVLPDGSVGFASAMATVSFYFTPGNDQPRRFRANLGGNWISIELPR